MNAVILNSRNEIIATIDTQIKSGSLVEYSSTTCKEEINANRELNLVNTRTGRISRARKYLNSKNAMLAQHAIEINESEFLI